MLDAIPVSIPIKKNVKRTKKVLNGVRDRSLIVKGLIWFLGN